jgi:hypothetical protein
MPSSCINPPKFRPGQNVISLVEHPPEIKPGTTVRLVSPWFGNLCAVQLPNGEIHRWFAWFELQPNFNNPGDYVTVVSNFGHGTSPHIPIGTGVKIVRCMPVTFYDVMLNGTEYHRWLADFEIAAV